MIHIPIHNRLRNYFDTPENFDRDQLKGYQETRIRGKVTCVYHTKKQRVWANARVEHYATLGIDAVTLKGKPRENRSQNEKRRAVRSKG